MNPGVRQLLMGGSQQWRNTLPALRAFVAANYDQPNPHNQDVMASPPTAASVGSTAPAGLTQIDSITPSNAGSTSALAIMGGRMVSPSAGIQRIWASTIGSTGGNIGTSDGKHATAWRARVIADASVVGFKVNRTTAAYRFIVDGRFVSLTGIVPTSGTGGNGPEYMTLDFSAVGGKARRTIEIEGQQVCGLIDVRVGAGDTIIRPSLNRRMIVLADSIGVGTDATYLGDSFTHVAADMLGIDVRVASGSSGTGYVNPPDPTTTYRLSRRLLDVNETGPWDIIVIAMGVNDLDQDLVQVTHEVRTCLQSIRAANKGSQIYVVGPWDQNAPLAPVTNYAATKAAIRAGIPEGLGVTFLDPEGVAYTNTDGLHPDTAGHKTLGDWLALQIKTALGA